MPNPIKDELVVTQAWILDAGFRIARFHYSFKAMGSSDVELEGDAFRMHWVRDRGTWVFAEVAPYSEQLWELTLIIEAVTGSRPDYDGTKLEALASLFRDNFDLLKQALGPDWPQTKAELERRYQQRLKVAMAPRPTPRIVIPFDAQARGVLIPIGTLIGFAAIGWLLMVR